VGDPRRALRLWESACVIARDGWPDDLSALPGVEAVSFSAFTFGEGSWNSMISVPGMPVDRHVNVAHNIIGDGYFKTMQIPLVAGRAFGPQDTATSQRVAIISEHVAHKYFPPGSPIGKTYSIGSSDSGDTPLQVQVIGIARDVKFDDIQESESYIDYLPYSQQKLNASQAFDKAQVPLKAFMLKQTREPDLALFMRLARQNPPATREEIPLRVLVPAFVTSELKSAFQIGFLIFIPFLVIDMIVASVLMSLGMMMLSPVLVALPFKLMLFVLADGWNLLLGSLAASFAT